VAAATGSEQPEGDAGDAVGVRPDDAPTLDLRGRPGFHGNRHTVLPGTLMALVDVTSLPK